MTKMQEDDMKGKKKEKKGRNRETRQKCRVMFHVTQKKKAM